MNASGKFESLGVSAIQTPQKLAKWALVLAGNSPPAATRVAVPLGGQSLFLSEIYALEMERRGAALAADEIADVAASSAVIIVLILK